MMRAGQVWWAVRLGAWLAVLPIRLRRHPLPQLLSRLTPHHARAQPSNPRERGMVVRVVVRLWRCFRGRLFPRLCLRQSLTLYYVLAWLGEPVALHVGVSKKRERLVGHSWVTVRGTPVAEHRQPEETFQTIYAFSANQCRRPRTGGGAHVT